MESNATSQNVTVPEGDDAIVLALAGGKSQTAAAELAGVCRDTVQRRLRDPEFRAKVDRVRGEMIERATGLMAEGAVSAVLALRNIVENENSPSVQVSAAGKLLQNLKLGNQECPECKRRAEEAANPPPETLDKFLARRAHIYAEYDKLKAMEAEAKAYTDAEDLKRLGGRPVPNVLCYEDGGGMP